MPLKVAWTSWSSAMIELKRERSNRESNYGVGLRKLWLEVLGADSLRLGRGMRNVEMREKRER